MTVFKLNSSVVPQTYIVNGVSFKFYGPPAWPMPYRALVPPVCGARDYPDTKVVCASAALIGPGSYAVNTTDLVAGL